MGWSVMFEVETILINTNKTCEAVRIYDGKNVHALEYEITDDGTVALEVYTSISGKVWPTNGEKATGLTKTSGPGSDGVGNIPLTLLPGDFIKVKATVTNDTAVLTLWFVQK